MARQCQPKRRPSRWRMGRVRYDMLCQSKAKQGATHNDVFVVYVYPLTQSSLCNIYVVFCGWCYSLRQENCLNNK